MRHIKVLYTRAEENWDYRLLNLLSRLYDVEILKPGDFHSSPDLLLYRTHVPWPHFAWRNLEQVDCLSLFATAENVKPNFKFFDYAFSFEETDDRNFQFPNFAITPYFEALRVDCYDGEWKGFREHPKTGFCNFIHSAVDNQQRKTIVEKLSAYKRVDCPGKACNNMPPIGRLLKDKLNFIKRHKFTIAFENQSTRNYVTEKITDALLVNSVPIYWGSPKIAEYFNPEAFINCHDYKSWDQVVDRIIEVDNDDELYRKYADAPAVLEGSRAHAITDEAIMERLRKIVDGIGVQTPVARTKAYKFRKLLYGRMYRSHFYYWAENYINRMRIRLRGFRI